MSYKLRILWITDKSRYSIFVYSNLGKRPKYGINIYTPAWSIDGQGYSYVALEDNSHGNMNVLI